MTPIATLLGPARPDEAADTSTSRFVSMPAQSRNVITVRPARESDLPTIGAIDKRIIGRDRSLHLARLVADAKDPASRVSLVAERDGRPVGFAMARIDSGDGQSRPGVAVLDSLGVDPVERGDGVGRALLFRLIEELKPLKIEVVRGEVDWYGDQSLARFLARFGFAPSQVLAFERRLD